MNKKAFLVLAALPGILACACGPSREGAERGTSIPEEAPAAAPAIEEVKKDYSFAAGGKVTLPAPLPADLPLYPEFEVRMAQRHNETDITIVLGTPSPVEDIETFYRRSMEEAGWLFKNEASLGGERFLRFEKGVKVAALVISPVERETIISLAYKETSMWWK